MNTLARQPPDPRISFAASLPLLALLLLVLLAPQASADTGTANSQTWSFRVYLDDREIGTHDFSLVSEGENRRLTSEAAFDVKFLFFTAFRYRHRNIEEWRGDCLTEIDAETVTNGERKEVSGQKKDSGFVVDTGQSSNELPGCVMSFAYWNEDFLDEARLLNPQTGEFLEVDVAAPEVEEISVRGNSMEARRYRVTARDIELQLWYSADDEWLSLESVAKGGRIIRYELI